MLHDICTDTRSFSLPYSNTHTHTHKEREREREREREITGITIYETLSMQCPCIWDRWSRIHIYINVAGHLAFAAIRKTMSIEALAMAGMDYRESGIKLEEWEKSGLEQPPLHLVAG